MILTDTGPLVALLDDDDPHHSRCAAAALRFSAEPMLTTWPCFTEAMHLLYAAGRWRYQSELWRLKHDGRLLLHEMTLLEVERIAELMEKYADQPMDLADATLVSVAESGRLKQIFTVDSDFRIYRTCDGLALEVVP
jgi:uncharacterized protein